MELWMIIIVVLLLCFFWDYINRGEKIRKLSMERDRLAALNRELQQRLESARAELDKLKRESPTPPSLPLPPLPPTDTFHAFFNWLEEDETYKEMCGKIENYLKRHPQNDHCLFCDQPVNAEESLPLNSLANIHKTCYERTYEDLVCVRSEDEAQQKFQSEPKRISLFYWILAHWPTYPPDWEFRRKRILERDHYECQKCGAHDNLHVHHEIHIEDGGHHTPDNLTCLCKDCHEKVHGYKIEGGAPKPTPFSDKLKLLKQAMREGKMIKFHYVDQEGTHTNRTFTPKKWANPKQYHGAICIKGDCHLRGAERNFIVSHMSDVSII